MATSKSTEAVSYTAGASVFSGRPDPSWPVALGVAGDLVALWNRLEPYAGPVPSPPGLGYRGCSLRDTEGREWQAYREVVTMTGRQTDLRRDPGRQFELRLLRTAPAGLIPGQILESEFGNQEGFQ